MKKAIRIFHFVLMHLCNALGIYCITCYILDIYNPLMKFIDNGTTKNVILILSIAILVSNNLTAWWLVEKKKEETDEV